MPVRKTESRIPVSFDKASELGYASYCETDNNYVLVSYLPKELRYDSLNPDNKNLLNKYCLFVNTDDNNDKSYSWRFSFYKDDEVEPFIVSDPKITEFGYFVLTSYPEEITSYTEKIYEKGAKV